MAQSFPSVSDEMLLFFAPLSLIVEREGKYNSVVKWDSFSSVASAEAAVLYQQTSSDDK